MASGTGNYLYTIAAHTQPATGTDLNVEGYTAVTSYDHANSIMVANSTLTIQAPGTTHDSANPGVLGANQDPSQTDRSVFWRVSDNGNNAYGNTEKLFFSVLLGNKDASDVGSWDGGLEMGQEESNWLGSTPSLTWHTPYLGTEVYTLIVPTDALVYESGTGRLGCALVWHIPVSSLGVYGQNANLPFRTTELPVASDADDEAASKIWAMGFGLIYNAGTNLAYIAT